MRRFSLIAFGGQTYVRLHTSIALCGMTGEELAPAIKEPLCRASAKSNFSSSYWVHTKQLGNGLMSRRGELPALGVYYNADQLTDPSAVVQRLDRLKADQVQPPQVEQEPQVPPAPPVQLSVSPKRGAPPVKKARSPPPMYGPPMRYVPTRDASRGPRVVVLDFETTGLSDRDQIVQIGAVEVVGTLLTGNTYSTNVYPTCAMNPAAQRVHGLEMRHLAKAPRLLAVFPSLLEFIGDSPVVCHNASFDIRMIHQEGARIGTPVTISKTICTMRHFKQAFPKVSSKLDNVLDFFAIDRASRDNGHDALIDATLTAHLYAHLLHSDIISQS